MYLVSHGNAGNLGFRLEALASLHRGLRSISGFYMITKASGNRPGEAKLANLIPDTVLVHTTTWSALLGYKPEHVILYGESIGCGVTTGIMKERKAGAVVLQSGFTSLIAAGKDKLWQLKIFPDWICPQPHLNNLTAVKQPHPPLLFIHGEKDGILPVRYSRTMYAEALEPKQYYEVKDAGHNDIGFTDLPELAKFTLTQSSCRVLIK